MKIGVETMDGKSLDIKEEKLNYLKEILPEAFTEGKIDWEKLKATLGDDIEFKNERYVLNWAGKSDAFRVLQSPSTSTLVPDKKESVDFDNTENVFIEGENLEVLKILQKSYFGKIKMIYIDPPYNTGNDKFIYPDKFSETKEEYLSRIGDKDESGYMTREGLFRTNSKDSGHYHSNWLSMIYPRLFLARNLLKEVGVIIVSIDDNEIHNLRLVMNEVFGEENFIGSFIWKNKAGGGGKQSSNKPGSNIKKKESFMTDHEYIMVYAKDINETFRFNEKLSEKNLKEYSNPDNDPNGPYKLSGLQMMMPQPISTMYYELRDPDGVVVKPRGGRHQWLYSKSRVEKELKEGTVLWVKSECSTSEDKRGYRYVLKVKKYLNQEGEERTKIARSILLDKGLSANGTREIMDIFEQDKTEVPIFSNPKPITLLKYLFEVVGTKDDIVLDFFAGSGSTGHAIIELNEDGGNRQFILVQLPEKCDEDKEAFKADYKTIADIGKERIHRVINKLKEEQKQSKLDIEGTPSMQDLGFKVFKLRQSNFKIWRSNVNNEDELNTQLEQFVDPVDETSKTENIIYELLLKSGVPLTATIEEKENYYLVNDGEIALILKKVDEAIIKSVLSEQPKKVITLDRLFKDNDQLKTNTALQMKDAEIEFKVV